MLVQRPSVQEISHNPSVVYSLSNNQDNFPEDGPNSHHCNPPLLILHLGVRPKLLQPVCSGRVDREATSILAKKLHHLSLRATAVTGQIHWSSITNEAISQENK